MNKIYINISLTILITILCIIAILNIFQITNINNLLILGLVIISSGCIGLINNNHNKSNVFLIIVGLFVLIVTTLKTMI